MQTEAYVKITRLQPVETDFIMVKVGVTLCEPEGRLPMEKAPKTRGLVTPRAGPPRTESRTNTSKELGGRSRHAQAGHVRHYGHRFR